MDDDTAELGLKAAARVGTGMSPTGDNRPTAPQPEVLPLEDLVPDGWTLDVEDRGATPAPAADMPSEEVSLADDFSEEIAIDESSIVEPDAQSPMPAGAAATSPVMEPSVSAPLVTEGDSHDGALASGAFAPASATSLKSRGSGRTVAVALAAIFCLVGLGFVGFRAFRTRINTVRVFVQTATPQTVYDWLPNIARVQTGESAPITFTQTGTLAYVMAPWTKFEAGDIMAYSERAKPLIANLERTRERIATYAEQQATFEADGDKIEARQARLKKHKKNASWRTCSNGFSVLR